MFDSLERKWMTSYKLNYLRTRFRQLVSPCDHSKIIFVFGCQRSGTTMMGNIIGMSSFVQVYGEGDLPYFHQEGHPEYLRLINWQKLKELMVKEKSQFTLLKPLYDSQVASDLINFFPGSRAIWIYRHYFDTVDSHIKNYRNDHNGIIYAKELFHGEQPSWKNENLVESMFEVLDQFANKKIDSATGYALFWLARNSLYTHLKDNCDVLLVNYEAIIAEPVTEFSKIFNFLSVPFKEKYAGIIHSRAVKKQIDFEIDPEVQQLCDKMYSKLQEETL